MLRDVMSELSTTIETVASQSRKVWTEEGGKETHSLTDLIKADEHLQKTNAAQATSLSAMGYRRVRMKPPGATGPT